MRRCLLSLMLTAAVLVPAAARATDILTLTPLNYDPLGLVAVGAQASVVLDMNFDDSTLGGAVTVQFDPAVVSLVSIDFDPSFNVDDIDFRCPTDPSASNPVPCGTDPAFLSFGNFGGISGAHTVAEITFLALAPGTSALGLAITRDFAGITGSALPVSVTGTSISVPEPGMASLLLAGMLALGRCVRTRRQRRV